MPRILFLDHAPIIGGAQLALLEHLRHLDRDAFTPHVACGGSMPALVERFVATGGTVHPFEWPRLRGVTPLGWPRVVVAALNLRRLVRREGIDLVVANTSRTAYLAAIALAGSREPVVWWVRDFDFGRRIFRALCRTATRVICVSNAIREYYGGNGDARYAVVPVGSGLHARLTQVSDARILDARRQWSLRPDDVVVGYMGRLVKDKGPEDLLDAIELLRRDFPRLRLLVVGTGQGQDGDVEEQLRQRVQREGLTSVIQFAGFQSDEALYYRLFDLFVLSSRYREAMPTSVIQAMMAGVPVVATRTGGTPEVVVDGETGLLVPPSAPTAIADALRRFLTDDALVQRITREAHERVNMHHREEVLTRRAEAVYTDAMTRSRSASAGDRRST